MLYLGIRTKARINVYATLVLKSDKLYNDIIWEDKIDYDSGAAGKEYGIN